MTDRHIATFLEEAAELLKELEHSLLELEERPDDSELVGRVFRAMHTLKGSGAMFGFTALSAFTHRLETVFDGVRSGTIPVTAELIGVTLSARDHIRFLLEAAHAGDSASDPIGESILNRLQQAVGVEAPATQQTEAFDTRAAGGEQPIGQRSSYRIRFQPAADILLNGTNPLLPLRELSDLGECSIIAHLDSIPALDRYDPEQCYTYWDAVLTTTAGENAIRDVFIFVEDRAQLTIRKIDTAEASAEGARSSPRVGEILVRKGSVTPDRLAAALLEQQHLSDLRQSPQRTETESTLRVPAAKLDNLVNIVGELVTMQARLSTYALDSGEAEIGFIAGEVERLAETLRESTMGMRMLPIADTFARFKRLVRDLSCDLGKRVELVLEGSTTELDKSVIEFLADPLVHLIRNAVDHGIERPERRIAAGKPAVGKLVLSAQHEGAFVSIRVCDDGGGLQYDKIHARAVEQGLIARDAVLSEQETAALILKPGFSTSATVSEISGRGVGTDVVQRSVEALRGSLSLESTPGRGTSITLRIPLTLAIIDGLLVDVGGDCFVVPLASISSCMQLVRECKDSQQSLVTVRDQLVPYIVLRDRFGIGGSPPRNEQVIIAETREGPCGLVVDRVIGEHHTVVKKLGHLCRHVDEVSGATILGNGKVALILDVEKVAAAVL